MLNLQLRPLPTRILTINSSITPLQAFDLPNRMFITQRYSFTVSSASRVKHSICEKLNKTSFKWMRASAVTTINHEQNTPWLHLRLTLITNNVVNLVVVHRVDLKVEVNLGLPQLLALLIRCTIIPQRFVISLVSLVMSQRLALYSCCTACLRQHCYSTGEGYTHRHYHWQY